MTPQVTSQDPNILLTVAVIGLIGVALGGVIQLITQRWVVRHDRMMQVRAQVTEFGESLSSYTAVLAQSAMMIDGVRDDYVERKTADSKAELELDQEYLERLGTSFFESYEKLQSQSISLICVGDHRVADQSNLVHLMAVDIQNETGMMFSGSLHISTARAKELQSQLHGQLNVLLTMVGPRKWERYATFRSADKAKKSIAAESQSLRSRVATLQETESPHE